MGREIFASERQQQVIRHRGDFFAPRKVRGGDGERKTKTKTSWLLLQRMSFAPSSCICQSLGKLTRGLLVPLKHHSPDLGNVYCSCALLILIIIRSRIFGKSSSSSSAPHSVRCATAATCWRRSADGDGMREEHQKWWESGVIAGGKCSQTSFLETLDTDLPHQNSTSPPNEWT